MYVCNKVKIMENNLILFNSVTIAMRAREVLKKYNIYSTVVRTPISLNKKSCGYSLLINQDYKRALEVLSGNGIAYTGTAAADAK